MNTFSEFFHSIKTLFTQLFRQKYKYNIAVNNYSVSQFVTVQKGCTAFMFTNVGNDTATVNGMVIFPGTPGTVLGDSRSIAAHKNDVYEGNIQLKFAGVGAAPNVEIVQVFYTNEQ